MDFSGHMGRMIFTVHAMYDPRDIGLYPDPCGLRMIYTGAKTSLTFLFCLIRPRLPDGRNMQTSACVAEELSYTSAARALDMSTGTASRLTPIRRRKNEDMARPP
jgi:hypothetical protein